MAAKALLACIEDEDKVRSPAFSQTSLDGMTDSYLRVLEPQGTAACIGNNQPLANPLAVPFSALFWGTRLNVAVTRNASGSVRLRVTSSIGEVLQHLCRTAPGNCVP